MKKFALGTYLHRGPMFIWSMPVVYLGLFAMIGAIWALLARCKPGWFSIRTLTFTCALLSLFTLLLLTGKLAPWARWLLSLGAAVRIAAIVGKRPSLLSVMVRGTLGWMGAIFHVRSADYASIGNDNLQAPALRLPTRRAILASSAATAAALAAGTYAWDRKLTSRSPYPSTTPPPNAPNVLFLSLDTVRAQSLSAYGYRRPTSPNLEQLGKLGIRFDCGLATAGWTLPSHATMFTGRSPRELTCNFTVPLDESFPTLAEVLGSIGYDTAGFVANHFFCTRESGLARGFSFYRDYDASLGRALDSSNLWDSGRRAIELARALDFDNTDRKNAPKLCAQFEQWLTVRASDRPYFAFLNFFDAHDPYYPPVEFLVGRQSPPRLGDVGLHRAYSDADLRDLNDSYDGAIRFLDHHIGELLKRLDERGELENTLVVAVGDHGEQFGEHGLLSHSNSLYMQLLRVPLFLFHKSRIPAGRSIAAPVSLRQLPATILQFVDPSVAGVFPGDSLARCWEGDAKRLSNKEEFVLSWVRDGFGNTVNGEGNNIGPTISLVGRGLHYIREDGKPEQLFDCQADPQEQSDLASTDNGRWQIESFREQIKRN